MTYNIILPEYTKYILSKLENAGFEAFCVGGCVRDSVMGLVPQDYDITTNARAEEVMQVFSGDKVIETGLKHGTVSIVRDGVVSEVTTYRIDGDYNDHRHPDEVVFTDKLSEDLKRRDFTINAMAYSPSVGLCDLNEGRSDIEKKIIRTVGNPMERFTEDALRILRGIRFAARFDFEIEAETFDAMLRLKNNLAYVSKERIYKELSGILTAPSKGLERVLSKCKDIFFEIIPELGREEGCRQFTKYHIYDVWTHSYLACANVEPDFELRLTLLLHDIGKPYTQVFINPERTTFHGHEFRGAEIADDILKNLRAPNKTRERIVKYILYHEWYKYGADPYYVGKLIGHLGSIEEAEKIINVFKADISSKSPLAMQFNGGVIDKIADEIQKYKEENKPYKISQLDITGNDLIELGIPKDKSIGETLENLLCEVMRGRLENKKEILKKFAKNAK